MAALRYSRRQVLHIQYHLDAVRFDRFCQASGRESKGRRLMRRRWWQILLKPMAMPAIVPMVRVTSLVDVLEDEEFDEDDPDPEPDVGTAATLVLVDNVVAPAGVVPGPAPLVILNDAVAL